MEIKTELHVILFARSVEMQIIKVYEMLFNEM